MKDTLISIIIPSYNQSKFIERTVKSVLNQKYKSKEIILIDGLSNDGTIDIIKKYESEINIIIEKDSGQSDAINKGFRIANGEIITWLNSDDVYLTDDVLSNISKKFNKLPFKSIIYGSFFEINENDEVLRINYRPKFSFNRLMRIGYISQPATFIKTNNKSDILLDRKLNYALDTELWLRLSSYSYNFYCEKSFYSAERVHQNAKCVRDSSLMIAEAKKVRINYGAKFNLMHKLMRIVDKIYLHSFRIYGIIRYQTTIKRKKYINKLTFNYVFIKNLFLLK